MTTKVQFQLTDAEKASPVGAPEATLQRPHRGPAPRAEQDIPETKTALIRGQIKALREQLALDKELPPGHPAAR